MTAPVGALVDEVGTAAAPHRRPRLPALVLPVAAFVTVTASAAVAGLALGVVMTSAGAYTARRVPSQPAQRAPGAAPQEECP